jgi:hypothetical protein
VRARIIQGATWGLGGRAKEIGKFLANLRAVGEHGFTLVTWVE